MKAIICFAKTDIHINSFGTEWTACACGNVRVKWIDPNAGTVVVAARDKDAVRLLGLNNAYLIEAIRWDLAWADLRNLHERATDAPGYMFDKSKIGCWAVVVRIGSTNDVRWASEEEEKEVFGQGVAA